MIWGSWDRSKTALFSQRQAARWRATSVVLACIAFACSSGSSEDAPEDVGESSTPLCTNTTFTLSPNSPIPQDATVRLTASASCTGPARYQFVWQMPGSESTTQGIIQNTSPINYADWNTTGISGKYNLYAWSSTDVAANSAIQSVLVGRTCGTSTLSASPAPSTIPALGTPLTFAPIAMCTYGGIPEYQVYYLPLGQTDKAEYVQVLGPGQAANSWSSSGPTLDTTNLRSGKYGFYVRARAQGNASVWESYAYTSSNYLLGDVCPTIKLSASPASPRPGGPSVTLIASPTCVRAAVPEFKFSYKKTTDSAYTFIGDWTSSPTAIWNTSNLSAGDYALQVYVRAAGNMSPNESYTVIPFKLTSGIPTLPPLQYREVTYARDASDYFLLPTTAPVSTAPASPPLRRANRFFFNLPTAKPLPLTFTVGNTSAPANPPINIAVYNSAGTVVKTAVVPSDYATHSKTTVVSLPNIAGGNYEIDVAPADPSLTYSLSTDAGITLALSNGADLADAGTLHFFVPSETDSAFLVGAFDPGTPVQFADATGRAVIPAAVTPRSTRSTRVANPAFGAPHSARKPAPLTSSTCRTFSRFSRIRSLPANEFVPRSTMVQHPPAR